MTTIHVLSPGFTNPNSCAFLFPFYAFQKELKAAGLNIKVFTKQSEALTDCDLLLIEHKALTKNWDEEQSLETLKGLSDKTKVIWCDQSDSSGTFLGQVLPYVSKYLKSQTLSDLNLYKESYYADRIYTDYYHKKHGITDDLDYHYAPTQTDEDIKKIGLSWNSGLMNHGYFGPYLGRILERAPSPLFTKFAKPMGIPTAERSLDVTCRMGISYPRATVRFQREQLSEILKERMPTNKLSRGKYFEELKKSKICISAFGYGEITLKDFEAFLTGSALLKPDMDHMNTWPNFYQKDKTYIAHSWDLEDVPGVIENYINDNGKRLSIAEEGQKIFKQYTCSDEAPALFIEHFQSLCRDA